MPGQYPSPAKVSATAAHPKSFHLVENVEFLHEEDLIDEQGGGDQATAETGDGTLGQADGPVIREVRL